MYKELILLFDPCKNFIIYVRAKCMEYTCTVTLFPGSPCAHTKNRKEREECGKIYHTRNVICR